MVKDTLLPLTGLKIHANSECVCGYQDVMTGVQCSSNELSTV